MAQFDWRMIVSLLYLGVLRHRAGLRLVLHVGQEGGRGVASIFNNLVPVFGVVISVLVLGEALLPSMLIGGAIAIVGVMMVSRA